MGLLGVVGTVVVGVMAKIISTLKGTVKELDEEKQSKNVCTLLHAQINNNLTEIKQGISDAKEKVSGVREDLIEIKTILKTGQRDETTRYDKHTKEWKEE